MQSSKSRLIAAAAGVLFAAGLPAAEAPVLSAVGTDSRDVYLQSLEIQIDVIGSVASTRHTMVFKNRTNRVLEGELTFPMTDGRALSYFALDIDGKMREGVPVEKAKATRVFEAIEQRRVDPGLLERVEGDNFRTRVYPVPPGGTRTVAVGYDEALALKDGQLKYRLPLDGYQYPIEEFAIKASVWKSGAVPAVSAPEGGFRFDRAGERYAAAFARKNYRPDSALILTLPAPADIPQVMTRRTQDGGYFFASLSPGALSAETRKKQWDDNLAIVWDVSLSGLQRDLEREMEMLDTLFAEKKSADVYLYFLNNTLTKMKNKSAADGAYKVRGGDWSGLKAALESAVFDGGTDFSKIDLNAVAGKEILFFSDGMSTLSDADFIRNSTSAAKRPIHCVVSSAAADYGVMRRIADKTNGKFVNLNTLSPAELKDEVLNETLRFLGTKHGGAVREVYPSVATPVHGVFSVAGIFDTAGAELTLLFGFGGAVERRVGVKLDAKDAADYENTDKLWAQKKIAELDTDYEKNRAEITELGRRFGVVTRNTSLMVLENIGDYIFYKVDLPPELLKKHPDAQKAIQEWRYKTELDMLREAALAAKRIDKWRNTDHAAKRRPKPKSELRKRVLNKIGPYESAEIMGYLDNPTPTYIPDVNAQRARSLDSEADAPKPKPLDLNEIMERKTRNSRQSVRAKPIRTDNDYLKRLTGKPAEDYKIYLELRDDYASSPAFYFDMAGWFYAHNDTQTALRVLTSIAELELENAALYRMLGYRLKEYGEYALEKFVYGKVIQWRPMDPQSYRDYALALADNGEDQAALDSLYGTLARDYPLEIIRRNSGMEETVVMEINRLTAKNPKLNRSKIDKRLTADASVDVRVVINRNIDNTAVYLYVEDPNKEMCYHWNRETRIGGRTTSYAGIGSGPEQFILKKAVKGKYRVYAQYTGDSRVTYAEPMIVMAEIYTRYAGKGERRRIVCSPLSKSGKSDDEKTLLAEFEF